MKKIFLFFVLISVQQAFAQDIIIMNTAERVEAIIKEVTPTNIKYKKYSNPEGPNFIVPCSLISAIQYANGDIQEFDNKLVVKNKSEQRFSVITKVGREYYVAGKVYDEAGYREILRLNCVVAYRQYEYGHQLTNTGWWLFAVGLGLDLGTSIAVLNSGTVNGATYFFSSVGGALEIACIPVLCIGYKVRRQSLNTYNMACARETSKLHLKANVTTDGIGLAINF